jgi:hypothetical protein
MLIETASGSSITRPVFVVGYRPTCAFGALRGRILVDADRSRRSEKRVSIKFALFLRHMFTMQSEGSLKADGIHKQGTL